LFFGLVVSGFIFKIFIALFDTPFLYFFVYMMRKRFNLGPNDELELDL
ncbi:MAG: VUT family protein, partial [Maribacter sp.]|nr:VUT family protein [Maribacter sp.]